MFYSHSFIDLQEFRYLIWVPYRNGLKGFAPWLQPTLNLLGFNLYCSIFFLFYLQRIAETLDVEIKRWAAGKEGNLRALLSTMQYVSLIIRLLEKQLHDI